MDLANHLANAVSIGLFLYFELACHRTVEEFERYGLSRVRKTTGAGSIAANLRASRDRRTTSMWW